MPRSGDSADWHYHTHLVLGDKVGELAVHVVRACIDAHTPAPSVLAAAASRVSTGGTTTTAVPVCVEGVAELGLVRLELRQLPHREHRIAQAPV